jgi:uncharacterized protein YcfJ
MKKTAVSVLIAAGLAATAAQAQEVGRVISSTPVIQQVAVPRQVCSQQQVAVQQPTTGAGAAMGAIAGGALGSQIGSGSGRGVATVVGLLGGAILGNNIESPNTQVQNLQQCTTQTYYENRAVSYNVVYEYAGKQYQVNLPNDPGPTVQLQVTPVNAAPPAASVPPPAITQPAPLVMAPAPVQTVVTVPPTVVYPAAYYAPRPYYYPPVSLSFGYVHHHGRRHWR